MTNIQVTHDANPKNARSESFVAINPNDPQQIVSVSRKFKDLATFNSALATQYSINGGQSWTDSEDLALVIAADATAPVFKFSFLTDPALAWDDLGNVFLVGICRSSPATADTLGVVSYRSTDGGKTWSQPTWVFKGSADKTWTAGDTNPASPHHGTVYAVWTGPCFARTVKGEWMGTGSLPAGSFIPGVSLMRWPSMDVSADGIIRIVGIDATDATTIQMVVSSDGGDSFQQATPPASGISPLPISPLPICPGATFRVIQAPMISSRRGTAESRDTVFVAWPDFREKGPSGLLSRIYFALFDGTAWTTGPSGNPLLTGRHGTMQHFSPQVATDPNGVLACAFYEYGPKPFTPLIDVILAQSNDFGRSFDPLVVTDRPWDPTVYAPTTLSPPQTFIGDYFGLDASQLGFHPLWTDARTGIQELWTAIVSARERFPLGTAHFPAV